jgi:hypothetical protein
MLQSKPRINRGTDKPAGPKCQTLWKGPVPSPGLSSFGIGLVAKWRRDAADKDYSRYLANPDQNKSFTKTPL